MTEETLSTFSAPKGTYDLLPSTNSATFLAIREHLSAPARRAGYGYVETPFRSRNTSLLPVASYAAALIGIVASVAFIANRQDGWPWRLSPEARQVADLQRFGFWPCKGARNRLARSARSMNGSACN